MSNLFIVHTPYHLVLASSINSKLYKEESDIIIYKDFKLDKIDFNSLNRLFKNIKIYEPYNLKHKNTSILSNVILQKIRLLSIKKIINKKKYDNIYVFNDGVLETQYIINKSLMNEKSKVIYVEDGSNAYMETQNGLKYNFINKIIKRLIYSFTYENLGFTFGTHSKISKRMVLWPKILRKELINDKKVIEEIHKSELEQGLRICYKNIIDKLELEEKSILILLEHIEFFEIHKESNFKLYLETIELIILKLHDKKIYIKYHPRDRSNYLSEILYKCRNIEIVENSIPAEIYFSNKNIFVISIFSTTLLTAAKLIYVNNIISLSDIMKMSTNNLRNSFLEIGIQIPRNNNELINKLY